MIGHINQCLYHLITRFVNARGVAWRHVPIAQKKK
jgi:hypothetical protein